MTTVLLDAAGPWVLADLDADPQTWARDTVRRRAADEQLDLPDERLELLARVLVPALTSARREDVPPIMVLFLLPRADQPSVCSVSVRVEAVEAATTVGHLLAELRLPAEMLEEPALEEALETRSGRASHLVQRYRVPVNPEYEMVQEHEVFVWRVIGVDTDLAVYLSTGYLDPVEAATWRSALVDLAASLTVTPDDVAAGA
jgi:hypothetical protein